MSIPDAFLDLFAKPVLAHLAMRKPAGGIYVTPIWIDYDGQYVLVNSAQGRVNSRNLEHHPQVAISILDPGDPFRYLMIRGCVAAISEQSEEEHRERIARRALGSGHPAQWCRPGEICQVFRIAVAHVIAR